MRFALAFTAFFLAGVRVAHAQARPVDWPSYGGDAQRTGWEKSDTRITHENVKDFQLVLKRSLGIKRKGTLSLSPPAVLGLLISYRGFKELAFVSDSADDFWAIDADLDRIFWQKHFDAPRTKSRSPLCSAAAMPSLVPPLNFSAGPPKPATTQPVFGFLKPATFGEPRPVFALASDGKLHMLNTANGDDLTAPVSFLPPGAKFLSSAFANNVLYTTTSGGCGGAPDGVWAIDLNVPNETTPPRVSHFATGARNSSSLGGMVVGLDGTVYAQTGPGPNASPNSLVALNPGDLKMKRHLSLPANHPQLSTTTPLVFRYKDRELIAIADSDGRVDLLNAQSPGDRLELVSQTQPVTSTGQIWGGLSTWEAADGTRYVYAPIWGPVTSDLAQLTATGPAVNGSVVAFRLDEHDGKALLTPAWVSRDMNSPEPPVITAGTVFALAAGAYGRNGQPVKSTHATLYAFDAVTGKEVYSSGNQVAAPGSLNGVTIANARVYFTTTDSVLYAFGIFLER